MKFKTLVILTMFAALFSCSDDKTKSESKTETEATGTKEESGPETFTMPDSATLMRNWQAYMTPGPEHKMMAKSNGTWNSEVTWWDYPGGPANTSKSTATNKMIMDGRYQVSTHSGNMMGMPFEGQATLAFDNHRKVFISTWIDNMGTGLMVTEGKMDDASGALVLTGKMVDPSIGKEVSVREVFKIVDDNTQIMEMYKPGPDGKEFKCMEIKYTKK